MHVSENNSRAAWFWSRSSWAARALRRSSSNQADWDVLTLLWFAERGWQHSSTHVPGGRWGVVWGVNILMCFRMIQGYSPPRDRGGGNVVMPVLRWAHPSHSGMNNKWPDLHHSVAPSFSRFQTSGPASWSSCLETFATPQPFCHGHFLPNTVLHLQPVRRCINYNKWLFATGLCLIKTNKQK